MSKESSTEDLMANGPTGNGDGQEAAVDHLPAGDFFGSFRTTEAGRMLNCNQILVDLLGYGTVEEIKKISVNGLYFDLGERRRFIEALRKKRRLTNFEILLKHRTGRPVHVLESARIKEEPGRPTVIEGIVIDITTVRQAELEQRVLLNNYRQLTERVRDGILVVQDGKAVFANPAAMAMLADRPAMGFPMEDVVLPADARILAEHVASIREGQAPEGVRVHFISDSGKGRPLMVHGASSWYMNGPAIQFTLHDAEAEHALMHERLRAKMAEEMNAVLRAEIAEHKRTQDALVKSRRLAKSLIDSSLDMIIGVDPKGNITEFNPAAAIKFGCEAEEMIGRNSKVLYADQAEFDKVQHEMARYGAYAGEVRNITAQGTVFTTFLAASKLFDENGDLIGSMGVSRDVTQAKRDREALRLSEERYRDLVDNAHDLIHSVDTEGRILFTNRAWRTTLGYTEEEIRTMNLADMVEPGKRETALQWLKGMPESMGSEPWRAVFVTKDGRHLLVEGNSTVRKEDGKSIAVRSIFRDITAAKTARDQLLKHAEKEKALFQASEHMFWTVDRRLALTSFNQGYREMIERLHGKAPEINRDPDKPRALFAPKDYHDFWEGKYKEAFTGRTVRFDTDRLDVQGNRVCNEIYLSPVMDAEGKVVEVFGIGHEVTAEKVAEAKAREHAAKLNAIFDSSADVMIWSLDRDNKITACNRHFIQVMKQGFDKEVKVGDNLRQDLKALMPKDIDRKLMELRSDVFKGIALHHEAGLPMADGSTLWVEFYVSPIITEGAINEISCLAYDITEKKRNEQELLENLREKETLLKEVHHRVKNNLQIISSIFNLQRDHVAGDTHALELIQESRNRILSMSFIHESLYQNKNFSQVDLGQYIDGLCRNLLMSYSLSGKVLLETELQPILLEPDKAIPCGLILNELISNALKHAFPANTGGTIAIRLTENNGTIMINLKDNGSGFPADYDEGRDNGLGMELVELLTDQLDGRVERSKPENGRGTTYLITFERT